MVSQECRPQLGLAVVADEVLPLIKIGVRGHVGIGADRGEPIIKVHWASAVVTKTGVIDSAFRTGLIAATHDAPFAEA